ncbi:MAG: hypothetical protein WD360_00510 [Nitriliruptoraceae bacterium]
MDRVGDLGSVEQLLNGAAVWGIELEPKFRVLGLTLEPVTDTTQTALGTDLRDTRLQLACFPVSTILGSLRQNTTDGVTVLRFTEAQLVDVVAAFDGAELSSPIFGRPEPRPATWAPTFSLEGRSSAPDGVSATITVSLRRGDLALDLFARFDEWRLLDATGQPVNL